MTDYEKHHLEALEKEIKKQYPNFICENEYPLKVVGLKGEAMNIYVKESLFSFTLDGELRTSQNIISELKNL